MSTPTPKEEYAYLMKLMGERMSVHQNDMLRSQYQYARDSKLAAEEGKCTWIRNAIGYLLKYPSAPYIDTKYFPSLQIRSNVDRTSAVFDSIAAQYAAFPSPVDASQFNQTVQYANANQDMRTLQGGPIQYTPTVQYQLGREVANPPQAETDVIGWLEKGADFVGNIASIGAGIFHLFSKW